MGAAFGPRIRRVLRGVLAAAMVFACAPALAKSQTLKPQPAEARTAPKDRDPAKLYVDADKLVYDKDRNIVTADGGVVLYYKNRILQGDHVVYDRGAKRVRAVGHVKLTDEHGNVTYSPSAELTDDFASGFADEVQTITTDKTRMTGTRAERTGGDITVLKNGVYTACEPCKAHPEWPPLWQVRAGEILENQTTHTVYFKDAYFDAFGVPVAYIPYFSAPDPTVTRESGLLAPSFISKSQLGIGVTTPYFLALAPNYDLTISPSFYTLQGPLLDVEWRHRTENGIYSVRLSGLDQLQPRQFAGAPYGAGNLTFRGALESEGKFYLNPNWTVGWDLTLLSDRFYLNDYRLRALDTTQYFFQDVISQVYLRGQAGRGLFDLSGYSFQPTTAFLDTRQDPKAVPTFDFHRTFALDADHWGGIGGEVTTELNAASVDRQEALYQSLGTQRLDPAYSLYQVCGAGTSAANYTPGGCILRGIAGDYTRVTEQVAWSKQIVDPLGEMWKPFVFERLSGEATSLSGGAQTYTSITGTAIIPNYMQPAFFSGESSGAGAVGMAGVGLEYRYPFVSHSWLGDQVFEPIGQLDRAAERNVAPARRQRGRAKPRVRRHDFVQLEQIFGLRPRRRRHARELRLPVHRQFPQRRPSQRRRRPIGAGRRAEFLHAAGRDQHGARIRPRQDVVEHRGGRDVATYLGAADARPQAAGRSHHRRIRAHRRDLGGAELRVSTGPSTTPATPRSRCLGYPFPREGLIAKASYKYGDFVASGGVTFDMSRRYYDPSYGSPFYATQYNVGLAYEANNCTTLKIAYNSTLSVPISTTPGVPAAPAVRDQTVLFELDFRTLGDVKGSSGVN